MAIYINYTGPLKHLASVVFFIKIIYIYIYKILYIKYYIIKSVNIKENKYDR